MPKFNFVYLIPALTLIIISAVLGYTFGVYQTEQQTAQSVKQPQQSPDNPLFQFQTATIQGKITKLTDNQITIADSKGQVGQFPLSSKLTIYRPSEGTKPAYASTDPKTISLNEPTSVLLQLMDGVYQVVSISYPPIQR